MWTRLARWWLGARLTRLLSTLQIAMVSRYGYVDDGYRLNQVRKTCEDLGIARRLWKYAEAGFVDRAELLRELSRYAPPHAAAMRLERLRDELAAANDGDYRFLPRKEFPPTAWDNGSNVDAASTWGIGL